MRRHIHADVRLCALYEFKLGHSVKVALDNLIRAYGANVLSVHTLKLWYQRFRGGDESLERKRKSPIDDSELKQLIEENPRIRMGDLARHFGVSNESIRHHIASIAKGEFRRYIKTKTRLLKKRKRKKKKAKTRNDIKSADEAQDENKGDALECVPDKNKGDALESEKLISEQNGDVEECITYFL
nr:histone-lysine N-methyltransferase SETMAR [Haemonchus contortus]